MGVYMCFHVVNETGSFLILIDSFYNKHTNEKLCLNFEVVPSNHNITVFNFCCG